MSEAEQQASSVLPWDPLRQLKQVDASRAMYSRGFLRSKPEKWFPGLSAHWLPIAHSLGVELRAVEVKPALEVPHGLEVGFGFEVDGEQAAVLLDRSSVKIIQDSVNSAALGTAREVLLEYLCRRFLGSLAATWSGMEGSTVTFDTRIDPLRVPVQGGVKVSFSVNGHAASFWLALGRKLVERFDGLWRRQVQSASKGGEGSSTLHLEIAQLAVPPSMLSDYMRSGTVIDLEIPITDSLVVRGGTKPLFMARLCNVGGNFGLETLATPAIPAALPDGTTRLTIEFGAISVDASLVGELGQVGSLYDTGISLRDTVDMVINGEKVGEAVLCTYEGRFAMSVS